MMVGVWAAPGRGVHSTAVHVRLRGPLPGRVGPGHTCPPRARRSARHHQQQQQQVVRGARRGCRQAAAGGPTARSDAKRHHRDQAAVQAAALAAAWAAPRQQLAQCVAAATEHTAGRQQAVFDCRGSGHPHTGLHQEQEQGAPARAAHLLTCVCMPAYARARVTAHRLTSMRPQTSGGS
jgi:hypothetical protein